MMNNAILMMVDKERVGDEVYEMIQMMNKTSEEIFQEPLEQAARI